MIPQAVVAVGVECGVVDAIIGYESEAAGITNDVGCLGPSAVLATVLVDNICLGEDSALEGRAIVAAHHDGLAFMVSPRVVAVSCATDMVLSNSADRIWRDGFKV